MSSPKRLPAHYTVIQVNEYAHVLDELVEHCDYDEDTWAGLAGYLGDCALIMLLLSEGRLVDVGGAS